MKYLLMILVGAATGITAAMGLGGGFILLLYFALFSGIDQIQAQGANLFFFLPVTAVSIIVHLKNKMIDIKPALICGFVGALTAIGGYFAAEAIGSPLLRKFFAVFVIIFGLKDLLFSKKKKQKQ